MKSHLKIALSLVLVGIISLLAIDYLLPVFQDRNIANTSDAKGTKGHIKIGVDNFIGYFPLCSPELKRRMRQSGYLLDCEDDGADYQQRIKSLESKRLNFAVATVDSYVLNGANENYPGTIVAVLDESKGGDALLAWEDQATSISDLSNNSNVKIAFTPNSPSHHLLKALSVHFDIAFLKKSTHWQVPADGSEDALKKLLSKQSDLAVLWEPDVSRALKTKGIKRILGTEETQQLIVDVLVAERSYAKNNPDAVHVLLKEYFKTLKYYKDNPNVLIDDVSKSSSLSSDNVTNMLSGVEWQTLSDNYEKWFGLSHGQNINEEALVDTIEAAVDILLQFQSLDRYPIPNRDPYRITNSEFISGLYEQLLQSSGFGLKSEQTELEFKPLSTQQWSQLKEIGMLKIRPIVFASGSEQLTLDGKIQLDMAVENIKHYPRFRIAIKGHTSTRGDENANRVLSKDRAEAVVRYLEITHNIDTNRIKAFGLGGDAPLQQLPGESFRAYQYRLPRVELVLLGEDF